MVSSIADAITENEDGAIITIDVSTGGKRNVFPSGFNPWRTTIGCRVTVPAVGGRANRALITLIAETLDLPESAVRIQSGAASPVKRVLIAGRKKADLLLRLQSMI